MIKVFSPHSPLNLQNLPHSPLFLHNFALNGGDPSTRGRCSPEGLGSRTEWAAGATQDHKLDDYLVGQIDSINMPKKIEKIIPQILLQFILVFNTLFDTLIVLYYIRIECWLRVVSVSWEKWEGVQRSGVSLSNFSHRDSVCGSKRWNLWLPQWWS